MTMYMTRLEIRRAFGAEVSAAALLASRAAGADGGWRRERREKERKRERRTERRERGEREEAEHRALNTDPCSLTRPTTEHRSPAHRRATPRTSYRPSSCLAQKLQLQFL
ncbi:hypothetical protein F7725_005046 [Dissostichus mawsoni]|uniref:Uncharacterized protein n=1 Tax=Dissostichus mawsoni TaxID=36200 RepID=A0A7J5XKH4_DISMA|nr:hypothetical protein F7725_005046 [Dissostichus mawsoni]